jgi:hypothetical protein
MAVPQVMKVISENDPDLPLLHHNGISDLVPAVERNFNIRLTSRK